MGKLKLRTLNMSFKKVGEYSGEAILFLDNVMDFMEKLRKRYDERRNTENFKERFAHNELRAQGKVDPQIDALTGGTDRSQKDGAAVQNLCGALSARNNEIAQTNLYNAIYSDGKRPWVSKSLGNKSESVVVERITEAMLEYFLRRADWYSRAGADQTHRLPTYGTSIIKRDILSGVRISTDQQGVFSAIEPGSKKPGTNYPTHKSISWDFFEVPLKDVWVSDYSKPHSDDQSGVFVRFKHMTIEDIMTMERVWVDEAAGTFTGRYINFKALWEWVEAMSGSEGGEGSTSSDTGFAPIGPSFDLITYQGNLPWFSWLMSDKLTPKIYKEFGFENYTGLVLTSTNISEVARRLIQISTWNIAYTKTRLLGEDNFGRNGIALQIEPEVSMRHGMYKFEWRKDRDKFLGQSIAESGEGYENAYNLVLNALLDIIEYNTRPAVFAKEEAFEDPDDINNLFVMDAVYPVEKSANDAVKALLKEQIPQVLDILRMLEDEFNKTSGIRDEASANLSSSTATEAKLGNSAFQGMIRAKGVPNQYEWDRMFTHMMHDTVKRMSDEDLSAFIFDVAGRDARGFDKAIDEIRNGEYEYLPRSVSDQDKLALAASIINVGATFSDVVDRRQVAHRAFEVAGARDVDELVPGANEEMSPSEIYGQLKAGNTIDIEIGTDSNKALQVLQQLSQRAQKEIADGTLSPDEALNLARGIPALAEAHKEAIEEQQAQAQAQAQAEQAQQGQGPQGLQGQDKPPLAGGEQQQRISRSANGRQKQVASN